MNATDAVVVEVAVNGATTRETNPHVPRSPAEIADDMLACVDAGASIAHNHNDEPMFTASGIHAVEPYLEAWRPVLERHPDLLLYPTMAAGARGVPVTDRWAHVDALTPVGGLSLIDPGSVNVGMTSDGAVPDAAAPEPYANPFTDIEHMCARTLAHAGCGASISIFEPGFLRTTLALQRAGRLPSASIVKLYFGGSLAFGLPPTERALEAYVELLDGCGLPWSVAVLGGDVLESGLAELAVRRGGHLRVGLEDHAGDTTPTNPELVRGAVELIRSLGKRPATQAEARTLIGLAPSR